MLSEDQIQSLFTFCEKHFVKYYDVQVELVDHLANAVELEMQKNSQLTFEKALEKVHQSFGVMGFAPLVTEKQKQAEIQSRKLFWKLFKERFGLSQILTFVLMVAFMYIIFCLEPLLIKWFYYLIVFGGTIALFFNMTVLQNSIAKTCRKFLIMNFTWLFYLIFLTPYISNTSRFFTDKSLFLNSQPNYLIFFISIFLSLYLIIISASWQTLSLIKTSLYKNYPEVFQPQNKHSLL